MSVPEPEGEPERGTPRCVICGKPQVARFRPFCSKRCAEIDLGRWLKGSYAIPGRPEDEEDGTSPPAGSKD